jgi:hypothetical protein
MNSTMILKLDSENNSTTKTPMKKCRDQDKDKTISTHLEVHSTKNPKDHNTTSNRNRNPKEEDNNPNIMIHSVCQEVGSLAT